MGDGRTPDGDANGQHDNTFDCHFAQRSAGRATPGDPLMQAPVIVRWTHQSLLSWMVRAVGIEPTLLAERDFESGAAGSVTHGKLPILVLEFAEMSEIRHFKPNCVRVCVSLGQARARDPQGRARRSVAGSIMSGIEWSGHPMDIVIRRRFHRQPTQLACEPPLALRDGC